MQHHDHKIQKLSNLGIYENMPYRCKICLLLYNKLLILGSLACVLFFIFNNITGFIELATIDTMSIAVMSACLMLNHLKLYELARTVGFVFIPLYLLFFRIFVGSPGIEFYFLALLIFGIYSLNRWIDILLLLGFIILLTYISQAIVPEFEFDAKYTELMPIHLISSATIASLLIGFTIRSFYKAGVKPFFLEK